MSNYSTTSTICNVNPLEGKPRQFGWKTINGWNYEAKKLAYCLIHNQKHHRYTWHATLNINAVITTSDQKVVFKQAARILRRQFTAFYIREPTISNHVNYHLILNSEISREQLRKCLQAAFSAVDCTITIALIYSPVALARYVVKHHPYANKRVYFATNCTLNKHGTIGNFWHVPTKQIWQQVITQERHIADTVNEHYDVIQTAAKYLHWLLDGYYSFKQIRRKLALGYNEKTLNNLASAWQPRYIDQTRTRKERA